jgi:hypothetical protein
MAVKTGSAAGDTGPYRYGVVWLKARTDTDIQGRLVTLRDVTVTRASFPSGREQEAQYQSMLQSVTMGKSLSVSLDQLEAALAIASTRKSQPVQVSNTPPDIIFAFTPAVLIHLDGEPVWRSSGVPGVEKAINTRAQLLRYQGRYFLGYAGHWASSAAINSGWAAAASVPPQVSQVMQAAEVTNQAPARGQLPPNLTDAFGKDGFPAVYIRTRPAELISIRGEPDFIAIPGTGLRFVGNTAADVFIHGGADHNWYVLISGRWFQAPSSKGPWRFIPPNTLPPDFARIPEDSPKGAVLASVAETPQAREAIIANSVPQTATVDRAAVTFQARYDGKPQFRPLPGTKNISYAVNSPVPLLNVPSRSYYALNDGVWFVSEASSEGPWVVATSVPPEIYAIPASSPLHYVTYVRVYGSNGRNVYVGYTPGYYGTLVANNVVVYGSGYPCTGWIGTSWYGCPETYGYGAALAYGAAIGWGMAFGWGWDYPWYNPWWGPWSGYYPGYYPWAYGGAAAWNVYGRWGNNLVAGTRAAWANPWTGNAGRSGAGGFYNPYTGSRGYGYAARNVNAYTGRATAAAGGIRYNRETGRVVAGGGAAAGNVANGNAVAGGARGTVNIDTGRATRTAGAIARGPSGATAAGTFNSTGEAGDAKGAAFAHYDRATGDVTRGGAVEANGNIYAGYDGNVYRNTGEGWEKLGSDNRFARSQPATGLDREGLAQARGLERENAVNNFQRHGGFSSGGGEFGSLAQYGTLGGNMGSGLRAPGGFRGGMRGGGGRRR